MPLVSVIALLIGLFWLAPTDPVREKIDYSCLKSAQVANEQREGARSRRTNTPFDPSFAGLYIPSDTQPPNMWGTIEKSGLRRAIEGRLKWLGLPNELAFLNPKVCPDPE